MKKLLIYAFSIGTLAACNSGSTNTITSDKEVAASSNGDIYITDSSSTITWTGSKPGQDHTGTLAVKEGSLSVQENKVTAGNFTIDMNSLNDIDLAATPDNKAKLEGHLKSPDFFNAGKYPTAKFEITAVEAIANDSIKNATHLIKGNLTIKDSTKNISFPARVTVDDKTVSATADFSIDRSLWGVNYKGPNNPQNWFIGKEVKIKLALTASKK